MTASFLTIMTPSEQTVLPRVFGLETEYGITREDLDTVDPVTESMELVRAHLDKAFRRIWDYSMEDPHQDARGFRASGLQQDKEEDEFSRLDAQRPFSFYDMKSDLVLPNGARFYNDHTHPEYSTPECNSLQDLVAQDRAGERILQQAANRRNQQLGGPHVQLYKNNTDFHGHSYGCHDNYLVSRQVPFEALASMMIPFLVSRQLVAGTGKVGIERQEGEFAPGGFQISQRADYMETDLSVDTMHDRPILNTRDEPHADRERYRRLHLILGDANMSEYATALKVGTTKLVLDLLEEGVVLNYALENPVVAIKEISHDPDLKMVVRLQSGTSISGLDLQLAYCHAAKERLSGRDQETDWILREWEHVLSLLGGETLQLVGRIDWITKRWLLEAFVTEERIEWDNPWLASLDLEYHNIDPRRGLFLGLEADGKTTRVSHETAIQQAMEYGPARTRGGIRGHCVRRFPEQIHSVQWERVNFEHEGHVESLELGSLFEPHVVQDLSRILEQASSLSEVWNIWCDRKENKV